MFAYAICTHLTLCNQLAGIELSDDSLKHLGGNGRQHTLVVILTQNGVNLWKLIGNGTVQNTQSNVDILQILAAGYHWHIAGLRPNVEDDGTLHPGNEEMGSFADNALFDAGKAVENHRPVATINVI